MRMKALAQLTHLSLYRVESVKESYRAVGVECKLYTDGSVDQSTVAALVCNSAVEGLQWCILPIRADSYRRSSSARSCHRAGPQSAMALAVMSPPQDAHALLTTSASLLRFTASSKAPAPQGHCNHPPLDTNTRYFQKLRSVRLG